MSVLVSLSVFGFLNSFLFTSSRIAFDAARNNHMPGIFAALNIKTKTPNISIIASCVLIVVFVFSAKIQDLVTMSAFADNLWSMMVLISFFRLRKLFPDEKRSLKVSLVFPITYIVSAAIISIVAIYINPKPCGGSFVLIISGVLVYPLAGGFPSKIKRRIYRDKAYRILQLITNTRMAKKRSVFKDDSMRRRRLDTLKSRRISETQSFL
ncbi:hypothetical protein ACOME3_007327 [Neoechinorhynchus agilis]